MPEPLTLLYSAHLRGDLALLPRLYTFLHQLGPVDLLLDLGDACEESVWHCAATGGRSTLHVLDAMGYHAANVSAYLSAEGRAKLQAQPLGIALLASGESWQRDSLFISTDDSPPDTPHDLHIVLQPAAATRLENQTLHLAAVPGGSVGLVRLDTQTIVEQAVLPLPATTLPDPTIAATVDFVLGEARYYQQHHS